MDARLVYIVLDVALAIAIAPAVMWLLWDLLDAFGGSVSHQAGNVDRAQTRSVLHSPSR